MLDKVSQNSLLDDIIVNVKFINEVLISYSFLLNISKQKIKRNTLTLIKLLSMFYSEIKDN